MTLGVNDEEILHLRTSYLFPGWTDRSFDTYFRWLANFPDIKILRFIYGWDYGDGVQTMPQADLQELCAAATRAGVRLIPQLMHPGNAMKWGYVNGTVSYADLINMERTTMAAFTDPAIYAWDLFNEMDVNGPFTGPVSYGAWVRQLVADVRSSTSKPLTVGHQGFGGGLWDFSQATFNLMNNVPGLNIPQVHWYGPDTNLSNTLDNYLMAWAKALGKPCLAGEFGSNQRYWPEFASLWNAGDALAMYLDGKPGYPPAGPVATPPPPPPPPVPGPDLTQILADIAALKVHQHAITGNTTAPLL